MGGQDSDRPRHFQAGSRCYIDFGFGGQALPQHALVYATLTGPTGLELQFRSEPGTVGAPPGMVRLFGNSPWNIPPGTYKVTKASVGWDTEAPQSWQAVPVPFEHMNEDAAIIIDPPPADPPQPAIPKLTDLD